MSSLTPGRDLEDRWSLAMVPDVRHWWNFHEHFWYMQAQDDAKNGSRFSRKNTVIYSERKLLLSLVPFIWLAWKHCYGTAILIWMPKHRSILGMNIVSLVFFRKQENFTKCCSSSMLIHWKHTNVPKDVLFRVKMLVFKLIEHINT